LGLSLRPGEEALVSRLARKVEPFPAPAVMSYTRGVTWLWTIFCIAQLLISGCLPAMAPLPVWSAFVNMAHVPLVIATFLAGYACQALALPPSANGIAFRHDSGLYPAPRG
jgi:uncharacterized membrane protein